MDQHKGSHLSLAMDHTNTRANACANQHAFNHESPDREVLHACMYANKPVNKQAQGLSPGLVGPAESGCCMHACVLSVEQTREKQALDSPVAWPGGPC